MAYGRKRSYKKRPSFRKKRVAYRKKRALKKAGYRMSKGIATNRSLTVRLRYADTFVTTSTVIQTNTAFNFVANTCNNFSNYSAIYDSYKVNKVSFKILTPINQYTDTLAVGPVNPIQNIPQLITALDWDSPGQVLGNAEECEAYATSRVTTINKNHQRVFTPKLYTVIRRSSISNAFIPTKMGMMDNATADTVLSPTVNVAWPQTYEPITFTVEVWALITFYGNRAS